MSGGLVTQLGSPSFAGGRWFRGQRQRASDAAANPAGVAHMAVAGAMLPATEFLSPLDPEDGGRARAPLPSSPGPGALPGLDSAAPLPGWGRLVKGAADRGLALVALLLLAPLILALALAVRWDSRGPVIFRQQRHGRFGREFAIYKFRTMRWNAAETDGASQVRRRDCRVTRVGGLLRRTSLDELPQLWNVLNGTMSLVGPRPHPVAMRTEGQLGGEIVPDYMARHLVKPGITGLAQINGNRGATATADQLRARVADDIRYVRTWSLRGDLRILLLTPVCLLLHREQAF